MTNVKEYEVRLLDKTGAYLSKLSEPIKYTSDANLFVDMSNKLVQMGSYGVELNIRKVNASQEVPTNIELSMGLCEKPLTNTDKDKEKVRTQQTQNNKAVKLPDSVLSGNCTSDEQCVNLITGNARCSNETGTCVCTSGYALNEYTCSVDLNKLEEQALQSGMVNQNVLKMWVYRIIFTIISGKVLYSRDYKINKGPV